MQRQPRLGFVLVYAGRVVGVGRGEGRPEGEQGPRGGGLLVGGCREGVWVAGWERVAYFRMEERVLGSWWWWWWWCWGWCACALVCWGNGDGVARGMLLSEADGRHDRWICERRWLRTRGC